MRKFAMLIMISFLFLGCSAHTSMGPTFKQRAFQHFNSYPAAMPPAGIR